MRPNTFVIGYKNHARRIILNVLSSKCFDRVFVYHPDKSKLSDSHQLGESVVPTDDFDLVSECECVFISSPSETHCEYIKKVHHRAKKLGRPIYIYCEKPIATNWDQINWLRANESTLHQTLFTGFNLQYSAFSNTVLAHIEREDIGTPISANFQVTHGLAFKAGVGSNWRFTDDKPFSAILGNLGIHYIQLSLKLFGPIVESYAVDSRFGCHTNSDGALITLCHVSGTLTSIFISYATIYLKRFEVFFTDGMVGQDRNNLAVHFPRDVFDSKGEFCSPPQHCIDAKSNSRDNTLTLCVNDFITTTLAGNVFARDDFKVALEASKIVLLLDTMQKSRVKS